MTTVSEPLTEWGSRQPFDLSKELAASVEEHGLTDHVAHMRDEGYAIIPEIATREFTARLRETCLRLADETEGTGKGTHRRYATRPRPHLRRSGDEP